MKEVVVILGPTSTGKTSLALELCKKINGEIISADSRQIYKHMDIGTGKLPIDFSYKIHRYDDKWVLDDVTVWGYDVVTPDKFYSSYDFTKFALEKLSEADQRGKKAFLVGGTGFYVDAVMGRSKLSGLKPDFELRKSLETTPTKNLLQKLMSLNPDVHEHIDRSNRRRIIRALEIELKKEKDKTTPLPYPSDVSYKCIGLKAPNDFMYARADTWLENVWQKGLVFEVEQLIKLGYDNASKLDGLVYKSAKAYLNKEISGEEAKQRAKFDLHSYIRRQLTWFKRNKEVVWFDISTLSRKDLISRCLSLIEK